jgi:DNA-binding Lrp family transcriptional regulator
MHLLRLLGKPSTANEVGNGDESVRKRARELAESGCIVACGVRVCSRSGMRAETFWFPERNE